MNAFINFQRQVRERIHSWWSQRSKAQNENAPISKSENSTANSLNTHEQMIGESADCVQVSSDIARLHLELENAMTRGNLQEAERLSRNIIRVDPGNASMHHFLGCMLSDQNRNQEAEPLYREAIRLDPNSAPAYNNLGVLLGEQGRLPEAEEVFRRAIRIESVDAYSNLGYLLSLQGRLSEAQQILLEALSRNPHHAGAQRHLADVSNKLSHAK